MAGSEGGRSRRNANSAWATKSLVEIYKWDSAHSPFIDCDRPLPRSNSIDVPHVRQLRSWDCGLACVSMVLRALGIESCNLKTLSQLCRNTSIWTVDLAYLLRHFSVDVAFLTITLGANPLLAVESFYKDNMEADEKRVNKLFEKAPQAGIQIQWRSISGEELAMLILSGRYLAIALVDKHKLSHPWLEVCLCCGLHSGYTGDVDFAGHYVVICGYDLETNEFEIKDPSSSSCSDKLPLEALDEARKSFGTDEDILLISMDSLDDASVQAMTLLSINDDKSD
ncbi:protein GUCD1 isoform X1 [Selaginella moellendorffii]|uniref:protein GUCD1 isoform X1 n=2 Tax=Selaginella moellendorffii TaxID=88036 RepID=UPI000D1C2AB0|nr:protein GUCD1 isoform X1 [Selaginella moellendorffii]|eukprot:XP_024545147.1 protein GUCD1 isoform X1 [Selaginella moellendorffii]